MGWWDEENDFENNNVNNIQHHKKHHKNKLKIGLLNVQGLVTKNRNKLEEEEVVTLFENNDIILLTEMWSNKETEIQLEGYVQHTDLINVNDNILPGILLEGKEYVRLIDVQHRILSRWAFILIFLIFEYCEQNMLDGGVRAHKEGNTPQT